MKEIKKIFGALFILVAIYSMIINLTILLTMYLDKDARPQINATEETEVPDRIFIDPDLEAELEPVYEYDFAQEGMRV